MSSFVFPAVLPPVVSGSQGVSISTFTRIGSVTIDPADRPMALRATLGTSDPLNAAEVRLFDVVAALAVPGSTLSTTSTQGVALSSGALALPLGPVLYDVQLRLVASSPSARALCTAATVEVL
jgi:hypothetical protein